MQLLASEDITPSDAQFLPSPFPWCWKRDSDRKSRTIFFLPSLRVENNRLLVTHVDFYYQQKGSPSEIDHLIGLIESSNFPRNEFTLDISGAEGSSREFVLRTSHMTQPALDIIHRL